MTNAPRQPIRRNAPHEQEAAPAKSAYAVTPGPSPDGRGEPSHAQVNLDRCRLSLIKGEHRWRFRWERGSEAALISAVADLARDPQMNFDWFDAAVVCRHIAQSLPRRGQGDAGSAAAAPRPGAHPKK